MGCFRFNDNKSAKKQSSFMKKNDSVKGDDTLKSASSSTSDSLTNSLDAKDSLKESDTKNVVVVDAANNNASLDLNPKEVLLPGNSKPKAKEARSFKFNELVAATGNFRPDCFLGEGGFGKVYMGKLPCTGEVVAVKQLDRDGTQGMREFIIEVLTLSLAEHPNLVKLIGYCGEGDQKLLVYEYMPLGSLENHLHESRPIKRRGLNWITRMKIAAGAAKGLEYLHEKMKPPVIYRDLKCSNILLGKDYHSKLSDFGLAKVGPSGDKTHVSTRVMGTYGYCAPEYAMTGQLTFKSDIYSFGVVLLELITGRKAIDPRKKGQNIVHWARPLFRDRRRFAEMVDPILEGQYPMRGLFQAIAIAAMCVQEKPNMRPNIADVVTSLNFIASQDYPPKLRIQNGEQEQEQEQGQNGKAKSGEEEGTSGWENKSRNLEEMPLYTQKNT